MLWLIVGLLLLYVLVLCFLFRCRRKNRQTEVVLQILPECPAEELEWILYSFRRFLDRELPGALWWVAASGAEQQAVLFRLAGRFAYRPPGCYNQEKGSCLTYRFTACSAAAALNWQRDFCEQGGKKGRPTAKWRNINKN